MADLRGEQLKDSYQNVVTRGTGNKLENGNGVEFADLDDKASLSAINNDEDFYEEGFWTPEYTTSAGDFASITEGSGTEGTYVKQGNVITAFCFYRIASLDKTGISSTASVFIKGLPFTSSSNFSKRGSGAISVASRFLGDAPISINAELADTKLRLFKRPSATLESDTLEVSDLDTVSNANAVQFALIYSI